MNSIKNQTDSSIVWKNRCTYITKAYGTAWRPKILYILNKIISKRNMIYFIINFFSHSTFLTPSQTYSAKKIETHKAPSSPSPSLFNIAINDISEKYYLPTYLWFMPTTSPLSAAVPVPVPVLFPSNQHALTHLKIYLEKIFPSPKPKHAYRRTHLKQMVTSEWPSSTKITNSNEYSQINDPIYSCSSRYS